MIYEHEQLRTLMNAIHRQLDDGMMPPELAITDKACDAVETLTRDNHDTDAQAWHRAATATKRLLRERGEDIRDEWIAAYADLPPMKWPGSDD